MIVSNLIGGLGNQMFQYACGRAISLRSRLPLRLAADQLEDYRQHNGFELLRVFNISASVIPPDELRFFLGVRATLKVRRLLGRPSMSWITGKQWCTEPHFDYWPGVKQIKYPVYLHGYWQSENYFADIANVIRTDFTFRAEFDALDLLVCKQMASGRCASLHVRRGDYLKGKFKNLYASCSIEYYTAAVRLLRAKFPDIRIFAFSDEPEWIVKNLQPELGQIEVVGHNAGARSANDMRLMSLADHHIIANSSFSWWGAWLNPSREKVVIAPKTWFADGRPTPTLLPSGWIRI